MLRSNKFMIATLRDQKKISQQELASKLNINRALLSQIETGLVLPSFDMLLEIARELDCLVTDLYHKEDLEIITK
jgi:transcriptional regulator with XRE-family HTH domain